MSDLETVLLQLAAHGRPSLVQMEGSGWYCWTNMRVAVAGASFKIESDSKHTSPLAAAEDCLERIKAMLRGFGESVKAIGEDR